MAIPVLSILIPSTPDRRNDLQVLLDCISQQAYTRFITVYDVGTITAYRYYDTLSNIEVLVFEDDKTMILGEKRELLYKHALGTYSIQVDSDDLLASDAISLILDEIPKNQDCITFEESVCIDGQYSRSNFSLKYKEWNGDGSRVLDDGFQYQRSPFYKCVIKTDIAKSVPFPKIRYNEDEQWSMALMSHLSTEAHIDKQIYIYKYESTPFNERYGFDKQ